MALVYDIDVDIEGCPQNMTFYEDAEHQKMYQKTIAEGVTNIHINEYVAVGEADNTHLQRVYWEWLYETGSTEEEIIQNDAKDIEDMENDVILSITATGTQVKSKPVNYTDMSFGIDTPVSDGTTINLEKNEETTLNIDTLNLEDITIESSNPAVATIDSNNKIKAVDKGNATITITGIESGETITINVEVVKPKVVLTSADYGKQVNYSITVSNRTLNNWKVFLTENDKVWIIYGDYLKSYIVASNPGSGLATSGTFCVGGPYRDTLITGLLNETYWSELLLTSELKGANAHAYGAATLEQWVRSWNSVITNESDRLYVNYENNMLDGYNGCYIGDTEDTKTEVLDLKYKTIYTAGDRYTSLYWPYKVSRVENTTVYGYWLASASADFGSAVTMVTYSGTLGGSNPTDVYSARPVICLPSSILEEGDNNTFDVAL